MPRGPQPEFPDYQEIRMTVKTSRGEIFDIAERLSPDATTSTIIWVMQRLAGQLMTEVRAHQDRWHDAG